MANGGMSMEAHTRDHLDLRGRDTDFLVYQIVGSIQSLEAHTSQPAHMFAYPSGHFDAATLAVLDSIPVWRAVTTEHGTLQTSDNWLEVPRLRVTGNMGVPGLAQLLNSNP
jgi:peptidoglycan/xylan/chitin deacetylase (PgdA/CDA1 family)